MNFLAQADIGSLPANFLKYAIIFVIVAILVASIVAGVVFAGLQYFQSRRAENEAVKREKETQIREIAPQPLQVTKVPGLASEALCDARHGEISRRLVDHDKQIALLWKALRVELPEMERRLNTAGEERTRLVHERINEILSRVSELSGEIKQL